MTETDPERLYAGCVAAPVGAGWSGALIRGGSGVGKSSFALRLIARGARLVSDDWTLLEAAGPDQVLASAPPPLVGLIEARGLGLMRLPALERVPVDWVIELIPHSDAAALERLPSPRQGALLGRKRPLLRLVDDDRMASALICLLRGGALLDPEAGLAERKDDA